MVNMTTQKQTLAFPRFSVGWEAGVKAGAGVAAVYPEAEVAYWEWLRRPTSPGSVTLELLH